MEELNFRADLLYWYNNYRNWIDNWLLYLEFAYLDRIWDILEMQEWVNSEILQFVLEKIWERQTEIMNSLSIN